MERASNDMIIVEWSKTVILCSVRSLLEDKAKIFI